MNNVGLIDLKEWNAKHAVEMTPSIALSPKSVDDVAAPQFPHWQTVPAAQARPQQHV